MRPRLLELGDGALMLQLGERIDPALGARIAGARAALARGGIEGISDLVPGYCSLAVHFDPLRTDRAALAAQLLAAADAEAAVDQGARHWELPVRFGGEDSPDLDEVARTTGRSPDEIVATLCGLDLRVYLIGFLPGFPYMGDLPEWLRLPRRTTPRTAVPAGSLAIAGPQVAIYPWQSPGGWHLLGRTDACLFDAANRSRPALLAPGDTVRLVAVGHA